MNSKMFRLQVSDFTKGLVVFIIAAIVSYLAQVLNVPGFDIGALDYHEVLRVAISAGVAYIGKNFISDKKGAVLGTVGAPKDD